VALLEFPNPVAWFASARDDEQKRELINATMSALYSAQICFLWRSGSSRWAQYIGEGKAMQDAAVAMYLSLRELERKNFLTLTLPSDMLTPEVLSKFQTEEVTK